MTPLTTPHAPPSRESNPFATCWTRPGALPWVPTGGCKAESLVEPLRAAGWRGQIVGPHGSGKSTLLRRLIEPVERTGREVVWIDARERKALPAAGSPGPLLFVEGFERLSNHERRASMIAWRRAGVGVLVTSHRRRLSWRTPLAVIASLTPDQHCLEALFVRLTQKCPTEVTREEARASFARHGGNLRDVWFDLYNRHETYRRGGRTAASVRP